MGFMALSAETIRRPSSWHPIWILKVLHMAFICAGMCFRIGSKTTNIKKHLLLWCTEREGECVHASSCSVRPYFAVFSVGGGLTACVPRPLLQGYKRRLGIFDGENER